MSSISECQRRAKLCSERAQTVRNIVDRARWRQLADQWQLLSRIKASMPYSEPAWHGELGADSAARQ